MRVRTMVFAAALACWPVTAFGQQGPAATQTGPTPTQVIDSPAANIGATVNWVVRFKSVVAEVGSDGRVVTDRILYEWRDAAGKWTGNTVVVPAAKLRLSDAAALRNEQMLQAEPRLIVGRVKGVEGIATSTGRTIAVALDNVTLDLMPAARPGAIGPGTGSGSFAPMTGVSLTPAEWRVFVDSSLNALNEPIKVEGSVELELTLKADGTVGDVRLVKPLQSGLDAAAIASAKQWTFKPGITDGKPVPVKVRVILDFGIKK